MTDGLYILIVEARFYEDVADNLLKGAVTELTSRGICYKRIIVPGILEIPAAIRYAALAMKLHTTDNRFYGYVVLGCAIKGETNHYEHICREAITGVQRLVLRYSLAVGNGILTCPTYELALNRSDPTGSNHGQRAVAAALRMIQVKRELGIC